MFENEKCYPATISTQKLVGNQTNLFFAPNKFLDGKTITGFSVYPFQEWDAGLGQYIGLKLSGTQAQFEFTSLTIDELVDGGGGSFALTLINKKNEIVLQDYPLTSAIYYMDVQDPIFIAVYGDKKNRQQIFKLENIALDKSYITGGMQAGKGIYFVFNYK